MLDLVVGLGAALLVMAGVAVIVGPDLPARVRALTRLVRRLAGTAASASANVEGVVLPMPRQSSPRTMLAAARLAATLGPAGREDLAAELRHYARRLALDEREGLSGLWATCRRLDAARFGGGAQRRVQAQLADLRRAISDRAEQLELLLTR